MPQRSHRVPIATVVAAAVALFSLSAAGAAGAGINDLSSSALTSPPTPPLSASSPLLPPPEPRFEQHVAQVEDGGEVDVSDRALIRSVQQALHAVGFDPGPIDGILGPQTRSAVRAYQRANDLPEDGTITKALLADLARKVTEAR